MSNKIGIFHLESSASYDKQLLKTIAKSLTQEYKAYGLTFFVQED